MQTLRTPDSRELSNTKGVPCQSVGIIRTRSVFIARIFYKCLAVSFEPNNELPFCLFMWSFGAFSVTVDLFCWRPLLERFAFLNLIWRNDLHTGKASSASFLAFAGATKSAFKDVRRKSCVAVDTAKLARVYSKVRFTKPGARKIKAFAQWQSKEWIGSWVHGKYCISTNRHGEGLLRSIAWNKTGSKIETDFLGTFICNFVC